jgi:acyl-CoA thioester hydrolase
VRYGETDRMGVVYYAHYFAWFEAGRADYMREIGANYRELEEQRGVLLAVAAASARYHAGAEYDDLVWITTWLAEANRARLRFCYEVHRDGDDKLLVTGETTLVSVTKAGRARMVPRDLLRLIPTEPGA